MCSMLPSLGLSIVHSDSETLGLLTAPNVLHAAQPRTLHRALRFRDTRTSLHRPCRLHHLEPRPQRLNLQLALLPDLLSIVPVACIILNLDLSDSISNLLFFRTFSLTSSNSNCLAFSNSEIFVSKLILSSSSFSLALLSDLLPH